MMPFTVGNKHGPLSGPFSSVCIQMTKSWKVAIPWVVAVTVLVNTTRNELPSSWIARVSQLADAMA